jgi:hypothetical protein
VMAPVDHRDVICSDNSDCSFEDPGNYRCEFDTATDRCVTHMGPPFDADHLRAGLSSDGDYLPAIFCDGFADIISIFP